MAAVLEANPRNVMLLASAAYWYAANKNSDKAIDLAKRAINVEPRYVWSYIALGRGYLLADRPQDAEETLLKARQYGNFPSLDYALASARYKAGFYRDAADALQRAFIVDGDTVTARIGNRVSRKGASFADVLADERRASILEPLSADDADADAQLKNLLLLSNALTVDKPDVAVAARAAEAFAAGDDNSKYHRQLYAASLLLDKHVAVDKALELAEAAVGNADTALSVPTPGTFVMASELYESRQLALSRGEMIKVPQVPHQTLSAILRGRIEDLIGWGMLQQNDAAGATLHFRRAVSVLPDKSAWWRAAEWRLGSALEADGKEPEALEAYINSYSIDKPDLDRYTTVANLYKKLNGSDQGLEERVGPPPNARPASDVVAANVVPRALPAAVGTPNIVIAQPTPAPPVEITPQPDPAATPDTIVNTSKAEPTPSPVAVESLPMPSPSPLVAESTPTPSPSPSVEPTPSPAPVIEAAPIPSPESAVTPTPEPTIIQIEKAAARTEPSPTPTPEMTPETAASPAPEPTIEPTPAATPTPENKPAEIEVAKADQPPNTEAAATDTSTNEAPLQAEKPLIKRTEVVITNKLEKPPAKPDEKTTAKRDSTVPDTGPAATSPRSLFEPVVITIPKRDASNSTGEKPDRPTLEIDRTNSADARPRLIEGQPVNVNEPAPCTVSVSQEKVSLLSNGGEASLLIGVDAADQLRALKYVISDPLAISVAEEKDFEGIEGRALYVVRSISEATGTFRVTFYLACGRRDVEVTVR
jgi:tetratricopeptide (TPR) repeat protein